MLSERIQSLVDKSSWVKELFSEGARRKKQFGEENVIDLSIGNPTVLPPPSVKQGLIEILDEFPLVHRYTPNQGIPEARECLAKYWTEFSQMQFSLDDIIITSGAGGGLNTIFSSILNPNDEVIVLSPFFIEYGAYVENFDGKLSIVETTDDFQLDFLQIEKAINHKTKAIIINSPNNPTGVIYPESSIKELGMLLRKKSEEYKTEIALISDCPYRNICYENEVVPVEFNYYDTVLLVTSFSKDLALPGERIGYIAVSPKIKNKGKLVEALVVSQRVLGFVNAPALFQYLIPKAINHFIDLGLYKINRDLLYKELKSYGYELSKPQGAFYLFIKSPIADDIKFVKMAQQLNLLLVPGSGFKKDGYFRVSYCFETRIIEKSLEIFKKLMDMCKEKNGETSD